jgi:hypothetical protein
MRVASADPAMSSTSRVCESERRMMTNSLTKSPESDGVCVFSDRRTENEELVGSLNLPEESDSHSEISPI